MAIKIYKPTTPARRRTSVLTSDDITKKKPEKKLILSGKNYAGRNSNGRITVRHRGGGSKKKIRIVDYKRDKFDRPGYYFIWYRQIQKGSFERGFKEAG